LGIAPSTFAQTDIWIYFNYQTVTKRSEDVTFEVLNTLRTGDADLRFYVTTVQDG